MTAELTSTIKYSPLSRASDIRLVTLQQALSYEWGFPSPNDPTILIDSENIITWKNLYDALLHIRLPNQDRRLWIDAICINQSDVLERNHQVHLMGSIYGRASHVIAWLGLARNDSDLGMDFLREWNHNGHTSDVWDSRLGTVELEAISYIATRSYWRRMWIIQETQLASQLSLQCGTKSVPANALSSYRYRIKGNREANISSRLGTADTPADFPLQQREKCLDGFPQSNLGPWLTWAVAQESLCTEPRDIVYALLGVAADCHSGMIEPDYTKPIEKVFADVFQLLSVVEKSNVANHLAIAFGLTQTWKHPWAPAHITPEFLNTTRLAEITFEDTVYDPFDLEWDGTIFGDNHYDSTTWPATIIDFNDYSDVVPYGQYQKTRTLSSPSMNENGSD